jgi:TPP-dependent pyruvate/acetoin dehydrogenase alpha subunit
VEEAVAFAKASPYPKPEDLVTDVYTSYPIERSPR